MGSELEALSNTLAFYVFFVVLNKDSFSNYTKFENFIAQIIFLICPYMDLHLFVGLALTFGGICIRLTPSNRCGWGAGREWPSDRVTSCHMCGLAFMELYAQVAHVG